MSSGEPPESSEPSESAGEQAIAAPPVPAPSAARRMDGRVDAWWLLVPLVIVGWTAIAGHRLLHLANADALLPALFSTQELTWFYWGQDRLANVVPLIASPVQDLRWNLALQLFLIGVGWFTLIALFAANHQHRADRNNTPRRLTVVVVASTTLNLALLEPQTRWLFIFEQLYAFSTVLLLAGLFALTRDRVGVRIAGSGVVIVAMMINPSLLLLGPVVLVLPQRPETRYRRSVVAASTMILGFVLTALASRTFSSGSGSEVSYNHFSLRGSLGNVRTSFDQITDSMNIWLAVIVLSIACVVVALRWSTFDRRIRMTLAGAAVFGIGWTLLFSANDWVAANRFNERYFFPIFAVTHLLITAAVAECVDVIYARWPTAVRAHRVSLLDRRSVVVFAVATTTLLSAFTVWRFTRSSMDVLTAARPAAEAAVAANAHFVVGEYWSAWPVVVAGRMDGTDLEGIAYRFDPRRDEVVLAIDAALAADGEFAVLCTWPTPQDCMNWLYFHTGGSFVLDRVTSESPLILTIRSADE